MLHASLRLARLLPLLAVVACQGSELSGLKDVRVVTALDPSAVTAGQSGAVLCALVGGGPAVRSEDFTVRVAPVTGREDGVAIAGRVFTGLGAGTYTIHCELPSLDLIDAEGAELTVSAGAAANTRPVFEDNPVQARTPTGVTCEAVDAHGNGVPIDAPVFSADPSLRFTGETVEGSTLGVFPVTCAGSDTDPGLARQAVDLIVTAGPPVRVELRADPERETYGARATVNLVWVAFDADDNPVEGLTATVTPPTVPPVTLVDAERDRYRLGGDGRYRFEVRLDAPAPPLADDVELIVDTTPPTVTITYPPRGATIRAGDKPVEVQGVVTDAIGVRSLTINGDEVTLRPDNTFSHPVASRWGLNNLHIVAADIGRNETVLKPTYQYSDAWTSFIDEDARGLQQPDAAVVLLGQNFLDSGERTPPVVGDMATLVELLLTDLIDLKALLDGALDGVAIPSVPLDGFEQRVDLIAGVSWVDLTFSGSIDFTVRAADSTGTGPVSVSIDSREGGLDMDILLGDLAAPAVAIDLELEIAANFVVDAQSCSFLGCLPNPPGRARLGATVTARAGIDDISFGVATDIAKSYGQPMQIDFTRFDTVIGDVIIAPIDDVTFFLVIEDVPVLGEQVFELPLSSFFDIGAIFDALITPFATQIANLLPGFINPLIRDNVGPLIAGLFDLLVIDTVLPVPPLSPDGAPVDIGFSTELSTVAFTDDGGTIGLATGLHTRKNIERNPLGAIVRRDCLGASSGDFVWAWDPSVGIGLTLDLGNAAVFTAWWAGLLNGPLDLGALAGGGGAGGLPIPVDGLALEMNWLLPPIFNDCDPDNGFVEIGDLDVTLSGNLLGLSISADMFAHFRLSVAYETRPDGLYVLLGDVLEADFELMRLDDGGLGELFDIRSLITDVLPGLLGNFLGGQAIGPIALPPTDLSTLLPNVPAGTTFGLGDLQVRNQGGYVIFGGDLR